MAKALRVLIGVKSSHVGNSGHSRDFISPQSRGAPGISWPRRRRRTARPAAPSQKRAGNTGPAGLRLRGRAPVAPASCLCETLEKPLGKLPPASSPSEPRPGPISLSPRTPGRPAPGAAVVGGACMLGDGDDCLESPLSTVWEKHSRPRPKHPNPASPPALRPAPLAPATSRLSFNEHETCCHKVTRRAGQVPGLVTGPTRRSQPVPARAVRRTGTGACQREQPGNRSPTGTRSGTSEQVHSEAARKPAMKVRAPALQAKDEASSRPPRGPDPGAFRGGPCAGASLLKAWSTTAKSPGSL